MTNIRIQLLARDACLHATIKILRVDFEHFGHTRKIEADAAINRFEVPLKRGARAIRNHRNARGVAELQNTRDFFVRLGEHHNVGQASVAHALAVAMVLAHRVRRHGTFAV